MVKLTTRTSDYLGGHVISVTTLVVTGCTLVTTPNLVKMTTFSFQCSKCVSNPLVSGPGEKYYALDLRYFKYIFLNENVWISIKFSKVQVQVQVQSNLFLRFNKQYSSIGSDNGLAPTRRQAVIWTNDGSTLYAYITHSASVLKDVLRKYSWVSPPLKIFEIESWLIPKYAQTWKFPFLYRWWGNDKKL